MLLAPCWPLTQCCCRPAAVHSHLPRFLPQQLQINERLNNAHQQMHAAQQKLQTSEQQLHHTEHQLQNVQGQLYDSNCEIETLTDEVDLVTTQLTREEIDHQEAARQRDVSMRQAQAVEVGHDCLHACMYTCICAVACLHDCVPACLPAHVLHTHA
jgi:septal ring factor EnvC (AmiA/AmiB activator)